MSKAGTAGAASDSGGSDLPFEEALQKLEAVVEAMESDELPLETMLSKYEEGVRLSERCQAKLAAAEVRIRQLEEKSGQAVLREAPAPPAAPAAD